MLLNTDMKYTPFLCEFDFHLRTKPNALHEQTRRPKLTHLILSSLK
jgi:hypothetical protein